MAERVRHRKARGLLAQGSPRAGPVQGSLPGYQGLVGDIAGLLDQARRASVRAVNTIMTETYWQIGRLRRAIPTLKHQRGNHDSVAAPLAFSPLSSRPPIRGPHPHVTAQNPANARPSGACRNFSNARSRICRIRSRVTPMSAPIFSSVIASAPSSNP